MANDTPLMPILREEIRAAGGRITFARFMELCLYHPEHGYYNTERTKLGRHGDFYTSSHVGPVFARLLAIHFKLLWHELGKPDRFDLVELGPGDGWFAAELLPWVAKRFPEFYPHLNYIAVEQSPLGRVRLKQLLSPYGDRAVVSDNLPTPKNLSGGITGCVFANEFFDALPIHILVGRRTGWMERYVCLNGAKLSWCEAGPSSSDPERIAAQYLGDSLEDIVGEACVAAGEWMERIAEFLSRGELLVVDYGYEAEEWRAGRFPVGSALGYRNHQVVEDLLDSPGEQDLTAHVNFTHLKRAGKQCGLEPALLMTQTRFLMELGEPDFQDVFSDCATDRERQQRAQQLKTLILPQGMGTTFEVLQFRKSLRGGAATGS
jgi:SAM-dependent MidA family methyltransferase